MSKPLLTTKNFQLFYTFFYGFEAVHKTVKDMATSGEAIYYMRAEKICETIGHYLNGLSNGAALVQHLQQLRGQDTDTDTKLDKIAADLDEKDDLYKTLVTQYDRLLNILLLQSTINPDSPIEIQTEAITKSSNGRSVIQLKPDMPITSEDYELLNYIAKCEVKKGELVTEYTKRFKHPDVRKAIQRLYYKSQYYFEQAFANSDIRIQANLLTIIDEDASKEKKNEAKQTAMKDIEDLHVLSTIDTSAMKMTSKVSDHQAFELFIKALDKNGSNSVITKLISDNIVMGTLFDISGTAGDRHYGFRRMFTTARYPHDSAIASQYRKLKMKDNDQFIAVVKELCKDEHFLEAWNNYLKAEKTKTFVDAVRKQMKILDIEGMNQEIMLNLCNYVDEFTNRESYNSDLLSIDFIMQTVGKIYGYLLVEDRVGKYAALEEVLSDFYTYRVIHAISTKDSEYENYGNTNMFGITQMDMWYDVSIFLRLLDCGFIEKVYLRYSKELVYFFDVGGPLVMADTSVTNVNRKDLPENHLLVECGNPDNKGFDPYIFNLVSRLVKSLMDPHIDIQVATVTGSGFRKSQTPGLSAGDEKKIRKIIVEYMSLRVLWYKDEGLFRHVYRWRVGGILDAMESIEANRETINRYVKIRHNEWIKEAFLHKAHAAACKRDFELLGNSPSETAIKVHSESFFDMAYPDASIMKKRD